MPYSGGMLELQPHSNKHNKGTASLVKFIFPVSNAMDLEPVEP